MSELEQQGKHLKNLLDIATRLEALGCIGANDGNKIQAAQNFLREATLASRKPIAMSTTNKPISYVNAYELFDTTIKKYNENSSTINMFLFNKRERLLFIDMMHQYAESHVKRRSSVIDLIEFFEDGLNRYNDEALFQFILQKISSGVSLYKIIDTLLVINKKNSALLAEQIANDSLEEFQKLEDELERDDNKNQPYSCK